MSDCNNLYYDKDYVYHATPEKNLDSILKQWLKGHANPEWSIWVWNIYNEPRLYFANSLIAAYDIAIMFEAFWKGENFIIIKIPRQELDKYEQFPDEKFKNSEKNFYNWFYILDDINLNKINYEIIKVSDLLNKWSDDELEWLYY